MDIYLSPIYILLAGLFIVILFSKTHVPTAVIASLAVALVIYTLYLHSSMFSSEYSSISSSAWLQSLAPTLLMGTVLLMSLSYIIFFFKKDVRTDYKKYVSDAATSWNPMPALPKLNAFNPFASKPTTTLPGYNKSSNMTKSEQREYISALNRLI